jgi:hypothetical protein
MVIYAVGASIDLNGLRHMSGSKCAIKRLRVTVTVMVVRLCCARRALDEGEVITVKQLNREWSKNCNESVYIS